MENVISLKTIIAQIQGLVNSCKITSLGEELCSHYYKVIQQVSNSSSIFCLLVYRRTCMPLSLEYTVSELD